MCGIAGIISYKQTTETRMQIAEKMATKIIHRGPDSQGLWSAETSPVTFAHRRLAIQDLSPLGHQPMMSSAGRYSIVFNGEIYNFRDLRSQLEILGHTFKGHSDTEVLLAAIESWGFSEALVKSKGMFAIALYDKLENKIFLARDRMGEKPLYYSIYDGQLTFASELKALVVGLNTKPRLDKNAIASYLRYGYISAPQSIYEGVCKLKPAAILEIKLDAEGRIGAVYEQTFWDHKQKCTPQIDEALRDPNIAVTKLDDLINKVISEQAIADVPLGAFLSGGIDSSTVAAILQHQSSVPVNTFTIGFNDKAFNEAEFAKEIATHIGSNHTELYLSGQDALGVVPKLATMYDEPFADSSQIPMYLVSELAKKKVTVCLSGDGGDELFAGYNRYTQTEAMLNKFAKLPAGLRRLVASAILSVKPGKYDRLYNAAYAVLGKKGGANAGIKAHKLAALMSTVSKAQAYKYLCGYWQDPASILNVEINEPDLTGHLDFDTQFLDAAMQWDQMWYLPGDNLVKTDRASMAVSLEMRLPLLDQELIEFAWQMPNEHKLRDGQSKWALRQVLYKYVPQKLIDRPKMGFSVPVGQWLKGELKEWCSDLLTEEKINQQGIFDYQKIRSCFLSHINEEDDYSQRLWTVLMLQGFLENDI
ncbi:asparagine synthase (glutamine-hydrolyzing) [Saccharophagus degradans]|uniref:asparagine synthase (glutamine-hydrolyzing) n=1 Tax=Saccharophagus degradans TaxID=86304 RepID=UPI00315928F4